MPSFMRILPFRAQFPHIFPAVNRSEAVILITGIRDQETEPDSGLFGLWGDRVS